MAQIKINAEAGEVKPGELRVVWNDGDGNIVVDFDPGIVHKAIKDICLEFIKDRKF